MTDQLAKPVKVCRDGPRGWHWIAAAHYDPAIHKLYDEAPPAVPDQPQQPEPKRRGRPPTKPPTETNHVHR